MTFRHFECGSGYNTFDPKKIAVFPGTKKVGPICLTMEVTQHSVFCPNTPDIQLAKSRREIEARGADSMGLRFKAVELEGHLSNVKSPCFVDTCTGAGGN